MGREIKRVPLDFDWPLNRVWEGFLNPHYEALQDYKCQACDGMGWSPAYLYLRNIWYRHLHWEAAAMSRQRAFPAEMVAFGAAIIATGQGWDDQLDADDVAALVAADRLWDFTRRQLRPDQETWPNGWTKEWNGYTPTPDEVNAWNKQGGIMGHDSINQSLCCKARCVRYGVSHYCAMCDGQGNTATAEQRQAYDEWEEQEPPTGEGWQVWETVSEGSPISPVFATANALVGWLVEKQGYSEYAARKFAESGWVPSMVGVPGVGLFNDIESAGLR